MLNDRLSIYPAGNDDEDYEEIDPQEVELVLTDLRKLVRNITSSTLRELLLTMRQDIACLADETLALEDEDEDELREAA